MKAYVVTVVDYSETADGKARTLGIFKTREEAVDYVSMDISNCVDSYDPEELDVDEARMSVQFKHDENAGFEWNVEEVDFSA